MIPLAHHAATDAGTILARYCRRELEGHLDAESAGEVGAAVAAACLDRFPDGVMPQSFLAELLGRARHLGGGVARTAVCGTSPVHREAFLAAGVLRCAGSPAGMDISGGSCWRIDLGAVRPEPGGELAYHRLFQVLVGAGLDLAAAGAAVQHFGVSGLRRHARHLLGPRADRRHLADQCREWRALLVALLEREALRRNWPQAPRLLLTDLDA